MIVVTKGSAKSGNYGHKGRPGLVGGSAPASAILVEFETMVPWHIEDTKLYGAMVGTAYEIIRNNKHASNQDWIESQLATNYGQGQQIYWNKDHVVTTISEDTGIDYDTVNLVIAQWAQTAGDSDMRALSLQQAASEEFGEPMSDFHQRAIKKLDNEVELRASAMLNKWKLEGKDLSQEDAEMYVRDSDSKFRGVTTRDNERKILRSMYNQTQSMLAKQGFKPDDEVTLFRGTKDKIFDPATGKSIKNDELIGYNGNNMESWTVSKSIADRSWFSSGGHILQARVKIKDILSSHLTGFGCSEEMEFLVLGRRINTAINWASKFGLPNATYEDRSSRLWKNKLPGTYDNKYVDVRAYITSTTP